MVRDKIGDFSLIQIISPDRKVGRFSQVNHIGIQGDMLWNAGGFEDDDEGAIWQANGGEDDSFDAVWEAEGKVYEDRWVIEMRIPFSSLRYPNQQEQSWAVHLVRAYPRENRYQFSWMPISQDNNSFMGQAGGMRLSLDARQGQTRFLHTERVTLAEEGTP